MSSVAAAMRQDLQSVMTAAADASQGQKSMLPGADVMPNNISICLEILAEGLIGAAGQHAPLCNAH